MTIDVEVGGTVPIAAQEWAQVAEEVAHKLRTLDADLDPDQAARLEKSCPVLHELDPIRRAQVVCRLCITQLGGLPPLVAFADPLARICLRGRTALLRGLSIMAIARRPGVVRCCIDGAARAALATALGAFFDHASALKGRAIEQGMASWMPSQWACVGYGDWLACSPALPESVRRLARLSLPLNVLDEIESRGPIPAELGCEQSIAAVSKWVTA